MSALHKLTLRVERWPSQEILAVQQAASCKLTNTFRSLQVTNYPNTIMRCCMPMESRSGLKRRGTGVDNLLCPGRWLSATWCKPKLLKCGKMLGLPNHSKSGPCLPCQIKFIKATEGRYRWFSNAIQVSIDFGALAVIKFIKNYVSALRYWAIVHRACWTVVSTTF